MQALQELKELNQKRTALKKREAELSTRVYLYAEQEGSLIDLKLVVLERKKTEKQIFKIINTL